MLTESFGVINRHPCFIVACLNSIKLFMAWRQPPLHHPPLREGLPQSDVLITHKDTQSSVALFNELTFSAIPGWRSGVLCYCYISLIKGWRKFICLLHGLSETDANCDSSTNTTSGGLTYKPQLQSINAQQGLDNCLRTRSQEIPETIKIIQHRIEDKVYIVHKVEFWKVYLQRSRFLKWLRKSWWSVMESSDEDHRCCIWIE